MNGVEHMRLLGGEPPDSESERIRRYLLATQNAFPYRGKASEGEPPAVEPVHAPYYNDTLVRAWSVMTGLVWGSFGFVLGAVVVLIVR